MKSLSEVCSTDVRSREPGFRRLPREFGTMRGLQSLSKNIFFREAASTMPRGGSPSSSIWHASCSTCGERDKQQEKHGERRYQLGRPFCLLRHLLRRLPGGGETGDSLKGGLSKKNQREEGGQKKHICSGALPRARNLTSFSPGNMG